MICNWYLWQCLGVVFFCTSITCTNNITVQTERAERGFFFFFKSHQGKQHWKYSSTLKTVMEGNVKTQSNTTLYPISYAATTTTCKMIWITHDYTGNIPKMGFLKKLFYTKIKLLWICGSMQLIHHFQEIEIYLCMWVDLR